MDPVLLRGPIYGIGTVSALAVNAGKTKAYLGRKFSMSRERHNLLVLPIDQNGAAGEPEPFRDSPDPFPVGGRSTIRAIVPHPNGRKLYVTFALDYPGLRTAPAVKERRLLTVYDLDDQDQPTGDPRVYDVGNPYGDVQAMALHPTLNLLYLAGWGAPQVVVYQLDDDGEPQSIRHTARFGGYGKRALSVSSGGERLYAGTYPDTLEIIALDANGLPTGAARSFPAGLEPGATATTYLSFVATPQALYRRQAYELSSAAEPAPWPFVVWPLNQTTGDPVGTPQSFPTLTGRAFAIDAQSRTVWCAADATFPDAASGAARRCGTAIQSSALDTIGKPTGAVTTVRNAFGTEARLLALASGGTPVVATTAEVAETGDQVRGQRLRVTVKAVLPAPADLIPLWVRPSLRGAPQVTVQANVGTPVELDLDPVLTGQHGGQQALSIGIGTSVTPPSETFEARLEVLDADGVVLADLNDRVAGNVIVLLMAGYGFVESPAVRNARIELLSAHVRKYLEQADADPVPEDERPKDFIVSGFHLLGWQGHLEQLRTMARAVVRLGMNTINAYTWTGLAPTLIDDELASAGLTRRSAAVYNPLSGYVDSDGETYPTSLTYFEFFLRHHSHDLANWARLQVAGIAQANGGRPSDVVDFKLSDEPGWYYPDLIYRLFSNPDYLADFHSFLTSKGLTPAFFGVEKLSQVRPVTGALSGTGTANVAPLEARKRYYWTTRFFTGSASVGHKRVTEALERAFGHRMNVDVNWNNWINGWYVNHPNQALPNNPDVGPSSGRGGFDWFTSGRLSAHTLWSADWFTDHDAQLWSAYADALRCAAVLGTRGFGAYIVGKRLQHHPVGASYKVLSVVARGAKVLDFYTFGPGFFTADGWSERFESYASIADAMRVLGRSEHLLYPGKPIRGKVAILCSAISRLWDDSYFARLHTSEVRSLHTALVHAGYTVDFVDDQDLATGGLSQRDYSVLYVTAPNVTAAALNGIAAWVQQGGTLAVTPGAASADEYDTATDRLDGVLGLASRKPERSRADGTLFENVVTFTSADFGAAPMPVRGPVQPPVAATGTDVLATFGDGKPAITKRAYGSGTAIAYGFYPGLQYWYTPEDHLQIQAPLDPRLLPGGWGAAQRRAAVAPAVLAEAPKPVIADQPLVEACRLESPAGVAIVLLNWSRTPISELELTIPDVSSEVTASTARGAPVSSSASGSGVAVRLPLRYNDVLLLENPG